MLGCSHAASGDAGYGPVGIDLANGYVEAGPPFERPAPLAWPIAQQPAHAWVAAPPVLPAAAPPVAASGDVRLFCVHVVEFLIAEAGEAGEAMDSLVIADFCHIQARTEKLARTAEQWQAFLACMLAADSEPEFDACESEHPTALFEPTEHAREREACQHLVMTTLYEELGHDTNLPAGELERFRPVIRECVDELVTIERAKRSPDDYAALLECVLDQSTSAAMEACE
jgi:hypothetical protein